MSSLFSYTTLFPSSPLFFFNDPATTEIYTLSLHDALPISHGSPYPTPEPIAIGEPGEGYPLPWAVYSWISGTIAYDADVAGSTAFAEDLATFVRALRRVPTEGRTFTGSWRGGVLTTHDEYVEEGLELSRGMIDVDALGRLWSELRITPRTEPDVWAH